MSEPLKPCPFCGGANIERYMAGIECADCGARTPDDLIWNKRTPPDKAIYDSIAANYARDAKGA